MDNLNDSNSSDKQIYTVEIVFMNDRIKNESIVQKQRGNNDAVNSESSPNVTLTKMTTFGVYKNLIVLSFSFLLLFSSLMSFSNIQSTVNIEGGLGTTGLAVFYAVMVFTSLFVTLITVPLLSYKTMMMLSMLTYICYVATGFYSSWYTVVPGSVIVGFGGCHLVNV